MFALMHSINSLLFELIDCTYMLDTLNPQIEELHLIRVCDSIMKDYGMRDLWYSIVLRLKKLRAVEVTRPWHLSSKMLDLLGQVEHNSYYYLCLVERGSFDAVVRLKELFLIGLMVDRHNGHLVLF